jgi:WD40 repeat protein
MQNYVQLDLRLGATILQAQAPFVVVSRASHCDEITALDAQRLGTLLVTAGNDHTVRVFDAATSNSIASFTVMDDISAVAVHPTCNLVLVASHASLVLLEITMYGSAPAPAASTSCSGVLQLNGCFVHWLDKL